MDTTALEETIRLHGLWIDGKTGGVRANLTNANLYRANLTNAILTGANLTGAILYRAILTNANLAYANLTGAILTDAILTGASLANANLTDATLPHFTICPEKGEFIAWKKLQKSIVAELLIPAESKRTSSLIGRKCRAEFVKVISFVNSSESIGYAKHASTPYVVGQTVKPDSYDDDIRVECTHGIHFFMTNREAENY